jgi:DNA-binding transcriptional ArsR family regulator
VKAVKVIRDPKAFQLVADDTRRKIIFLLRVKERTVSQIAEELEKTPQAIYHHIGKLRDAEMVEVAREERVDHFIETYYRASAELFEFHYGKEGGREYMEKQVKETLENLPRLGIDIKVDGKLVSKVVDLQQRMNSIGDSKTEWVEKVEELKDLSFTSRQEMIKYANLLSMSDEQMEEYPQLHQPMRALLDSRLNAPIEA